MDRIVTPRHHLDGRRWSPDNSKRVHGGCDVDLAGPRWLQKASRWLQIARRLPLKSLKTMWKNNIFAFGLHSGAKESLDGPRWSQDGPTWPQDGPRWSQDGPRWPQDGPKMAQDDPKMTQDGLTEGPRRPRTSPRRPQERPKTSP